MVKRFKTNVRDVLLNYGDRAVREKSPVGGRYLLKKLLGSKGKQRDVPFASGHFRITGGIMLIRPYHVPYRNFFAKSERRRISMFKKMPPGKVTHNSRTVPVFWSI
ncbi:hypothetical protein DK28_0206105 [Peptococcaceae bacterium SCADC1_2_3]|nr:hypothetical protein DK28_0206105 [Peptococcaceae bacterium SCADC1_2_3]KFI34682.1 hypothetical protein HY00_10465 [Peptococcaceae bacterium SCADC1_2_3]